MTVSTRGAWVVAAAAAATLLACRPSEREFDERIFACTGASSDECGTTADGSPMTCFPATQLGAADNFCVPACDGTSGTADADRMCVTSGASLLRCRPSDDDAASGRRACPPDLNCMRTDLLGDEGVCTTAPVCYPGSSCVSEQRQFCGGDLLAQYFNADGRARLHTDHLPCLKAACRATGTACPGGEMCLPDVVRAPSTPPDLCMPACADSHCPPNYECAQVLSAPSAAVCVPGLPGARCADEQACLIGDCLPIGEDGFAACTIPCGSDADCMTFDGPRGAFICGTANAAGDRTCLSDEIFTGTLCTEDAHCRPGEKCIVHSVNQGPTDIGYCLIPCYDGVCRPRAGVPHACRTDGPTPYCYPGKIGIPCSADDECVGNLACLFIPDDRDQADQPIVTPVCTTTCTSDADCAADRFSPSSWCNGGFCSLKRNGDRICPRDGACRSGRCAASDRADDVAQGISRCTPPPPDLL